MSYFTPVILFTSVFWVFPAQRGPFLSLCSTFQGSETCNCCPYHELGFRPRECQCVSALCCAHLSVMGVVLCLPHLSQDLLGLWRAKDDPECNRIQVRATVDCLCPHWVLNMAALKKMPGRAWGRHREDCGPLSVRCWGMEASRILGWLSASDCLWTDEHLPNWHETVASSLSTAKRNKSCLLIGVHEFDKLMFLPHVAVRFFWSDYVDFKFNRNYL